MKNSICWIDVEKEDAAGAGLNEIYAKVRSTDGRLDNLYQAFSLRAHTITPADELYKAALHHHDNTLPKWFSELIGTYVAILAGCQYARAHHGHNYAHLSGNVKKAEQILACLAADDLESCGSPREVSVLYYVKKLCLTPQNMEQSDIEQLSIQNWSDGEVLEIVQVVAMFSYFVRVINSLGISLGDEKLGLY